MWEVDSNTIYQRIQAVYNIHHLFWKILLQSALLQYQFSQWNLPTKDTKILADIEEVIGHINDILAHTEDHS